LEFEQFENGEQNKSEQEKNLHANKSPKQKRSSHWLKPKKIFHKKREQEIQQSQTDEENHSPNQFVSVKLPDEKFQLLINNVRSFQNLCFVFITVKSNPFSILLMLKIY
jgi:hypothetical protein